MFAGVIPLSIGRVNISIIARALVFLFLIYDILLFIFPLISSLLFPKRDNDRPYKEQAQVFFLGNVALQSLQSEIGTFELFILYRTSACFTGRQHGVI